MATEASVLMLGPLRPWFRTRWGGALALAAVLSLALLPAPAQDGAATHGGTGPAELLRDLGAGRVPGVADSPPSDGADWGGPEGPAGPEPPSGDAGDGSEGDGGSEAATGELETATATPAEQKPESAATEAGPEPGGEQPPTAVPGEPNAADGTGEAGAEAGAAPPSAPAAPVPDRVERRLSALARMAERPPQQGSRSSTARQELVDELRREAAMSLASTKTDLSQLSLRVSDLEAASAELAGVGRRVAEDVRSGRRSVAQGKEEIARLAEAQSGYDAMYDEFLSERDAARASARKYRGEWDQARSRLADQLLASSTLDVLGSLMDRADMADRLAEQWARAVQLAGANSELAAEAIAAIEEVVATAHQRALLYRSPARVSWQSVEQGLADLSTWLDDAWAQRPVRGPVLASPPLRSPALVALAWAGGYAVGHIIVLALRRRRGLTSRRAGPTILEAAVRAGLAALGGSAAAVRVGLPWTSAASYVGPVWGVSAFVVAARALRTVSSERWEHEGDRAAWRRTRLWLTVVAAALALGVPTSVGLHHSGYQQADVVAMVEAVFGLVLVAALFVLLGSNGPMSLLRGSQDRGVAWLVAHAGTVRLLGLALGAGVLAAHLCGWANLARLVGRGASLTVLWFALAVVVRPTVRRWKDDIRGAARRPHADPWLEWVPELVGVAWYAAAALTLMWAWGLKTHHVNTALAALAAQSFSVKGTQVSVASVARGLAIGAAIILGARRLRNRLLDSAWLARFEPGGRYAISVSLYYVFVAVGVLVGFLSAGLELSILTVFAGVTGIAVGFGSQELAKNFISGIIILLDRSVNVGDYIIVGTTEGTIHDISIRCTTLHTPDNKVVIVPNSILVAQQVINATLRDRRVRVALDVNVTPDSDPDAVIEILRAAATAHPDILADPAPQVWMSKLAAASLAFQLVAWTGRIERQPEILGELTTVVWKELRARGVALV